MRQADMNEEAIPLLLQLVDAIEAQSVADGCGVAPWYYEQLAIVYRKLGRRDDEICILQRFAMQRHARGTLPPKLLARLAKLSK
jgi:hypothetical protein